MAVNQEDCVGEAADRRALAVFRRDFYQCLRRRADALFELGDAVLCASGPVTSLPELTLDPVHRRGHGAMYDAMAAGRIDVARLPSPGLLGRGQDPDRVVRPGGRDDHRGGGPAQQGVGDLGR